jgi:aspartyl-tRNA(Asn)/glutamyl-tRNA(Gln) amidotransferase subunit A
MSNGIKTSASSKMLDNFIAPYDATANHKFNQADLVMLGKTNMDEFAMGSSNENSFYGAVKNPWNKNKSHLFKGFFKIIANKVSGFLCFKIIGISNENSFYGAVKNPWNKNKSPGGSSGGSAAAVADRLVPFATGTDTGGSIRQPSSLCGITGLKPTYGCISRYGMIAYASSLDQAGPITQTAKDAALVLNVMAGFDEKDSTSAQRDVEV